jgi:hypothetical protein
MNMNFFQFVAKAITFGLVAALVLIVGNNFSAFALDFIVAFGISLGIQVTVAARVASDKEESPAPVTVSSLNCASDEPSPEVQEPKEPEQEASYTASDVSSDSELSQVGLTDEQVEETEVFDVEAEVSSDDLAVLKVQIDGTVEEEAALEEDTLSEISELPVEVTVDEELNVDVWADPANNNEGIPYEPVTAADVVAVPEQLKLIAPTTAIAAESIDDAGSAFVLDAEVSKTEEIVSISELEPAVLEIPVNQEQKETVEGSVSASDEENGEMLSEAQVLEELKGLSATKAWNRLYDYLASKYALPKQDRRTSSQKSRANLLWRHNIRKCDLERAKQAALSFQTKKGAGKTKAS